MLIFRLGASFSLPLMLGACSFNMDVPENYLTDNTEGCAITVEDASRTSSKLIPQETKRGIKEFQVV